MVPLQSAISGSTPSDTDIRAAAYLSGFEGFVFGPARAKYLDEQLEQFPATLLLPLNRNCQFVRLLAAVYRAYTKRPIPAGELLPHESLGMLAGALNAVQMRLMPIDRPATHSVEYVKLLLQLSKFEVGAQLLDAMQCRDGRTSRLGFSLEETALLIRDARKTFDQLGELSRRNALSNRNNDSVALPK